MMVLIINILNCKVKYILRMIFIPTSKNKHIQITARVLPVFWLQKRQTKVKHPQE